MLCVKSHSTKNVSADPGTIRKVVRKGPTNREFDQRVVRQICEQWLHPQRSSTTLSEKPWFGYGIHFLAPAISKSNSPPTNRFFKVRPWKMRSTFGQCLLSWIRTATATTGVTKNVWSEVKYPLMYDGQRTQHIQILHMVRTWLN
jgi:hypothetical protein